MAFFFFIRINFKYFDMELIDYIDFKAIYEDTKKIQLDQYPTAEDYISYLASVDEPSDYVTEMYRMFNDLPPEVEACSSETNSSNEVIDLNKNLLHLEWSIGGNNATENGDDYWSYGWRFTINMEYDLFEGYKEENYS